MHNAGRILGWLIVNGLTIPATIAAQDVRELGRRLDMAVVARDRARASADSVRKSRAVVSVYPDTVTLVNGNFSVVTAHEFLPLVKEAAARADSAIRYRAGDQDSVLRGAMLKVRTDSAHRLTPNVVVAYRIGNTESVGGDVERTATALQRTIEAYATGKLLSRATPAFRHWASTGIPADTASAADWRAARLELVSSKEPDAHHCYDGDLPACARVLALEMDGKPVPAGLLIGYGRDRAALLQTAMALGGAGAVGRIAVTDAAVPAILAAAARQPADSVVRLWQSNIRTRGVASEAFNPIIAIVALGWIGVMVFFALRSSRWR